MLLKAEGLTKVYDNKKIFENISFSINKNDKVGLLGLNGAGKSTLLNIIAGIDNKYDGVYQYIDKNLTCYYIKQNEEYEGCKTIVQLVLQDDDIYEQDDNIIAEVRFILKKLGFTDVDLDKTAKQLSGGMLTKIALARAMLKRAEFLILDEPNNHLDMEQLLKLEEFLQEYKGTIIIVSHDRRLLDNVCNKIVEIEADGCKTYKGNYSDYVRQKDIELRENMSKYESYRKERNKLKQIIEQRKQWFAAAHTAAGQNDFLRSRAKKQFRVVKSKQIALEKLESNKCEKPQETKKINPKFEPSKSEANIMIRIENLSKSYNQQNILEDFSITIKNKERYCLIGENGSGKTTLLNLICGVDREYSGTIKISKSLKITYYRQKLENLKLNNTILEEITSLGQSPNDARQLLGCFFIKGDDVFRKVEQLSIGERSRLSLLKVVLSDADILILDEPTNHMDVYTKEKIEEALLDFNGAIIFVSHDRYFIEKISTRVLAIQEKRVIEYPSDYKYYKEKANKLNQSCRNITKANDKMIIENQISYISGRLCEPNLSPDEKKKLEEQYFALCRERVSK